MLMLNTVQEFNMITFTAVIEANHLLNCLIAGSALSMNVPLFMCHAVLPH